MTLIKINDQAYVNSEHVVALTFSHDHGGFSEIYTSDGNKVSDRIPLKGIVSELKKAKVTLVEIGEHQYVNPDSVTSITYKHGHGGSTDINLIGGHVENTSLSVKEVTELLTKNLHRGQGARR